MAIPFLTLYLSDQTSLNLFLIGLIVGIPALVQLCLSLFASSVIQKTSMKFGISISLLLPMFGLLGYITFDSFALLFLSSVISGIGWAVYNPLIMTALTDFSSDDSLDDVMGINYWMINLGGGLGPLIGVYIGAGESGLPFVLFAGVLIILFFLVQMMLPSKQKKSLEPVIKKNDNNFLRDIFSVVFDIKNFTVFSIYFLLFFIEVQFSTNVPIYLRSEYGAKGTELVGWILSAMTFTVIIAQPFTMKFLKRLSTKFIFLISTFLYCLGLTIFSFSEVALLFIVAAVFIALGEVVGVPKLQALNAKNAPEGKKTTYFAFIGMGGNLAYFLGPPVGSLLLPIFEGQLLFIVLICCAILYSLLAFKIIK